MHRVCGQSRAASHDEATTRAQSLVKQEPGRRGPLRYAGAVVPTLVYVITSDVSLACRLGPLRGRRSSACDSPVKQCVRVKTAFSGSRPRGDQPGHKYGTPASQPASAVLAQALLAVGVVHRRWRWSDCCRWRRDGI